MNTQHFLRTIPAFSCLEDEHLALFAARLATQSFKRGKTIFLQGSPGSTMYIIVSGQVRIYTINQAGQELSVTIFRAGDFFGELALLDGQTRSASAEAMHATRTLTLEQADFLHLVHECPPIAVAVMKALALRLRNSTASAEYLANHSAPQRVMHQLARLAAQNGANAGDTSHIELCLTQDDLASLSGTTRETVNRVLSNLRDQGLIQVERARIRILDLTQFKQSLTR